MKTVTLSKQKVTVSPSLNTEDNDDVVDYHKPVAPHKPLTPGMITIILSCCNDLTTLS